MKTIEDLRKEVAALEAKDKESEEYSKLEARKKELEEKGTLKDKARKVLRSVRSHLKEKGSKFQDNGQKLKGKEDDGFFKKPDFGTGFGNNAREASREQFESPLTKKAKK